MQFAGTPTAATPTPTPQTDWIALITQGVSSVMQLTTQQKLAKVNLARAQQGLPPITLDQVPGATPTVAVGLDPGTRNVLLIGGVVVAGLIAVKLFGKKRR